jgi:hypothetical protein
MAKQDCRRLIQLLYAYPLRGRKAGDFAIWAPAANWWIGADPTQRRPDRDWGPMPYLKERLTATKKFTHSRYICTDSRPECLSSDWPDYLAGFITAEGHLGICKGADASFTPRAAIRLRADDAPLLEQLRDRLRAGKIYGPYSKGSRNPVLNWTIVSRRDLLRTVQVLDENPVKGRKRKEYVLWRRAVEIHASESGSREPRQRQLASLHRELGLVRAYPSTNSD